MSLTRVGPENLEVTTLLLQPSQSFTTSSLGASGSIRLVLKPSPALKGFQRGSDFGSSKFTEEEGVTDDDDKLYEASTATGPNIFDIMEDYLGNVNASRKEARQTVIFVPSSSFSPGTSGVAPSATGVPVKVDGVFNPEDALQYRYFQRKVIENCLIPDQLVQNPKSNYAYTNYHCLNFMSSSNTPTGSSLIYPNLTDNYTLSGSFTIDFFVKPKAQLQTGVPYHPGTIMHMTSSFCISLHTASIGADGRADSFKISFQTNTAANTIPYTLDLNSPPAGVFVTDAVLNRDTWHRVTVRWDPDRNDQIGAILVDGINVKSISFSSLTDGSCKALFIGNFYYGTDNPEKFFNTTESTANGTLDSGAVSDPSPFQFLSPLNAEIHQISLFNRYVSDDELRSIATLTSDTSDIGKGPIFYLPVSFTGSAPTYTSYITPTTINSNISFDGPVNSSLALGYNTNFNNIQNFLVDEVTKNLPRAYGFHETSAVASSYDLRTSDTDNVMINLSSANRKRAFFILPCDNGLYDPVFKKVNTDTRCFFDDRNEYDQTLISLKNLGVATSVQALGRFFADAKYDGQASLYSTSDRYLPVLQNRNATIYDEIYAISNNPDLSHTAPVIFSIPTPFYGTRIVPGTFTITDSDMSGSAGLSMTLRDDGIGNLYRSNSRTAPAKWNRVGAIFYDHGLVCILNPHIPHFAKTGFNMNFRGETRKVVASYTVIAGPGEFNLSKNKSYKAFPPTGLITETADEFVYITGINLHDDNLNVIMRAKLAQPIKKREYDELAFRLRYDF